MKLTLKKIFNFLKEGRSASILQNIISNNGLFTYKKIDHPNPWRVGSAEGKYGTCWEIYKDDVEQAVMLENLYKEYKDKFNFSEIIKEYIRIRDEKRSFYYKGNRKILKDMPFITC